MYEQLTGLKQERVVGKNVRSLVQEGIFDHILNPEIVRTGKPTTRVQQLSDGKKLVLSGFSVFDQTGAICLVLTFVRDVTSLTDLQERLDGQRQLIEQINDQLAHMAQEHEPDALVFASQSMSRIMALLERFAATDATVLILGETGSGKEQRDRKSVV